MSSPEAKQAISVATEKRLSRFSFGANYAKPASATTQQDVHAISAEKLTEALTSLSDSEKTSAAAPVSKSTIPGQGLTLTLPAKRPATPSVSSSPVPKLEQNSLTFPRLPESPRSPSPVSGVPELVRRTGSNLSTSTVSTDDDELESPFDDIKDFGAHDDIEHVEHVDVVVTPKMEDVKSPIVSMPPSQLMMSPTAMDSDSLYKAFVDRWCFATAEGVVAGNDVGIEI